MFNTRNTTDVQRRILTAATDLFIRNGFRATSVRDIAAASDASVAMVNYYFRSKYTLFEMIFEDALDALFERVFKSLHSELPFFELLEAWINSYYEILMEYPQLPIFILNEINQDPKQLMSRMMKREPYSVYRLLEKRINDEAQKQLIRETPVHDFILNMLSLCVFPFMFRNLATSLTGASNDDYNDMLNEHKKYVVTFIINALTPPPKRGVNEAAFSSFSCEEVLT
ncbi:MAG: TetR/AcrR family transcriptional regulator [Cytophagaceae bacterium]|jgi:AcrR family transcriptional regulator|nr:TetR/AcrR family transcriptional regulator [Cytophagaceae bacterium]